MLGESMPDKPNVDEAKDELTPVGWLRFQRTKALPLGHDRGHQGFEFNVVERKLDALSGAQIGKVIRRRKRQKTGLAKKKKTDGSETDVRTFSL